MSASFSTARMIGSLINSCFSFFSRSTQKPHQAVSLRPLDPRREDGLRALFRALAAAKHRFSS
jgi:hypothetical protein